MIKNSETTHMPIIHSHAISRLLHVSMKFSVRYADKSYLSYEMIINDLFPMKKQCRFCLCEFSNNSNEFVGEKNKANDVNGIFHMRHNEL